MLAADRRAAIHRQTIWLNREREGSKRRDHGIAAIGGIHREGVVAFGGRVRRASEAARRGVQCDAAWKRAGLESESVRSPTAAHGQILRIGVEFLAVWQRLRGDPYDWIAWSDRHCEARRGIA